MIRVCGLSTCGSSRVRRLVIGCCVALTLLAAWAAPRLIAQDSPVATLVWQSVPGATGYVVYWGSASRTYVDSEDVGPTLSWDVPAPAPGRSVYMVVVAYDDDGQISQPSAEVVHSADNPNRAPTAGADLALTDEDTPSAPIPVIANDTDPDGDALTVTNAAVADPSNGTVDINADNTLTFVPALNWNGTAAISYTVIDGRGGAANASVSVTVTPVNDAPKAVDDNATVQEDSTDNEITVLANDTDVDDAAAALTISVTDPLHGTARVSSGVVLYTPESGYVGTDSFTYSVSDAAGSTDIGEVSIVVDNANDAPVAVDDAYETNEDVELVVPAPGVLGNDTDEESDALTAVLATGPSHGTVSLNSNGSFIYQPAANYFGPDGFTYTVGDGPSSTDAATVAITVRPVNDAPVADDDRYEIAEDAVLTVEAAGVLDGDTDVETSALTAVLAAGPSHGTLELNAAGSFTYTPTPNFSGTDSFTYKASDGTTDSAPATVTITVGSVNDAPAAVADTYSTAEDTPLTIAAPGVLDNDTDEEKDSLTAALGTNVAHGTLVLNADGSFSYTPNANFSGSDSFTYSAKDGDSGSNAATVTITVTAVNDPPVGVDDAATVAEDSSATAIDVLANDTDVDNDARTVSVVTQGTHGVVALAAGGTGVSYTPNANFAGSDSFTYTIDDGNGGTDTATVQVTVTAVNDAPVAANDAFTTNEDVALTVMAPTVLANDTDADSEGALRAAVVTTTAHGSLALNENGSFTYTPTENFNGTDTFTYKANDGGLDSNEATVTITVVAVNDGPDAEDDAASTAEDVAVDIAVLGNDSDPDGGTVSLSSVGTPAHGTASANASGSVKYTPNPNYFGVDSFTYTISDGQGGTDSATVNVTITSVNDGPTAADDAATTNEDTPVDVAVLTNDSDADGGSVSVESVGAAGNGAASLNANGTIKYTPNANYYGADSFSYTITDGQGGTATANVTVAVTAVNDGPAADDDSATTNEDVPVDIAVLGNDTDPDGGTVALSSVGAPQHGTATANANGTVKYTPHANYFGADNFTYTITDGQGGNASATVAVTISSVNDGPTAVEDEASTNEDATVDIAVLANDTDADNGTLSVSNVGTPANGTAAATTGGVIGYTPNANHFGTDSFTYTISDGQGGTATASVTVTIASVNDGPAAVNDSTKTDEDVAVDIDVAGNDTDPDGGTPAVASVGEPVNGTTSVNPDGTVKYTPKPNYFGPDTFTYTIDDGQGSESSASVTVMVESVNDAPVAVEDAYSTDEDLAVTIAAPGVLANDTDVDNSTVTAIEATAPANGTLTVHANGSFTYTPNAGFSGTDSFTYRAHDGALDSNAATVTIAVAAVNDAPVARDDSYATDEDAGLTVAAPGVLANDSDPDAAATLTAALVSGPANGTATVNANGSFTYTPNPGFNGTDSFTYRAHDGSADSNDATVTIAVAAVNDAPVAENDSYSTDEDVALTVIAPGVLSNDTDRDEATTLTAALVEGPANGELTLNADGSFTYTPEAGFHGSDRFSYRAKDGGLQSTIATVTLTIRAVNDAPTAANDSYATDEDVALTVAAPGILGNDTDPDGSGTLTASPVAGPANGTLVLHPNGSFTYTPTAGFHGADTFTYRANDASEESDVATVTITINSVNDGPTATDDTAQTAEDTPVDIAVLANDSDADAGTLSVSSVGAATHGGVTVNANGTIRYVPNPNYFGPDTFTYTIEDGQEGSASATVTVSVSAVNDAPVATDDAFATVEDTVLSGNVLGNDTDVDGGDLAAARGANPANGTLVLNADGSFTYTPKLDFTGTDTFTYTVSDGKDGSDTATVTITVNAVNDAPVARGDGYGINEDTPLTVGVPGVLGNDTDTENDSLTSILVAEPANGALTLNANGTFTYQPNANYHGLDTFTYKANDGTQDSNAATVSIRVNPVNDAPVAVDDAIATTEDTPAAGNVLTNDTDVDGGALSAAAGTAPSSGTVVLNADGSFTYTPNLNFSGTDTFTYTVSDADGGSDTGTVTVTVGGANDAPVANADADSVAEDSASNAIDVLANDTDLDGDTLTVSAVTQGTNGAVAIAGRSVTYTPNGNYAGVDTFTYTIGDGNGASATATVTVTVTAVNDAPIANADSASVAEDSANKAIDVLANDTDVDGGSLTVTAVTQGANGTVAIAGDGVSYTPRANFVGADSFTYTASDGDGGSATATVTITVTNANDAPEAMDDAASVAEDSANTAIDTLANDRDEDGDTLKITGVTQGAHGSVAIAAGGVTYTPNANFVGADSFTYSISDGNGGTDSATVAVTVTNVNDGPAADPDAVTVVEDSTNNLIDVVVNDTDPDGDTLTIAAVTQPLHGLAAVVPGGVSYTPNPNYAGVDTFTYTITDGRGGSASANVTVAISTVNDAPIANDDTANVAEDTGSNLVAVLSNDSDLDGDALTIAAVTPAAHGAVAVVAGGISYTPTANFVGSDRFTYTISDGNGGSDSASVTVLVTNANDAPVANADSATVAEDSAHTPINVIGNDTDPDGDSLTVAEVTQGANGSVAIAGSGVTYSPNPNYVGTDSFSYTISDGSGAAGTAIITVTVTAVNDAPTANADSASVAEDSANNAIDVLANDSDLDGDSLTVTAVTQGANGTVAMSGTGVTYTPRANFVGPDSFSYTISDGHGGSATASVAVSVTNANDAPVAQDDQATVAEDSANNPIDVLANDNDPDGDTLTIAAVTQGAHGSVAIAGGRVSYTPNANFVGADSFTYTIKDGDGGTESATVNVTVTNANDAPSADADSATVAEDSVNNPIKVLANDADGDGDTLTIASVTQGAHGSVAIVAGGVTYTPKADYAGADSFSYTIGDGHGGSATATVAVTVTAVNDAPVGRDDAFTTAEGTPATGSVLANDTDIDSSALTAVAVSGPAHGVLSLNANGSFTYAPGAGFSGNDSFTYKVSDGQSESNVATVSITVTITRRPPVARDDAAAVVEDSGANAVYVLVNDSDADGDPLKISAVTQGANGAVVITGGGSGLTYAPRANFAGTDQFTYTITDGSAVATATVSVTVKAVNDAPDATADTAVVLEGSAATTISVLANDTTIEAGEILTIKAVTQPPNGGVIISGATTVRYTPDAGFAGTDTFSYTIQDGNGGVDTATVTVTVQSKPDISINDIEVVEGDLGFTTATFTLRLSHPVVAPITVKYATADGIARAGQDYEATSGTITFAPGEVTRPLVIKVIGDTTKERNEVFAVSLGGPTNGDIARATGYATIVDDESTQTATTSYVSSSGPGRSDRDEPRLRRLDDQVGRAGDRVKLDLKVRDGDIDDMTVFVEGLPEGLRYDVEEGAIVGRLSRSESAGEYTITVKISNGRSASTDTFDWVVRPPKGSS